MLINKINIEGLANGDELGKINLKGGKVFNYNTTFRIQGEVGIKDIIQITINQEATNVKHAKFKDCDLTTVTVLTSFKILTTENKESNALSIIEREKYFNYSFESKAKKIEDVSITIIDCYFKLVNNHEIIGTLTYLFREKEENIKAENKNNIKRSAYRLIDITQEFA